MVRAACDIDPYDLTRIVHGGRRRARGAGEINRRQRSFVEQKAVTLDSARTASISADDMARIVDAEGHRERSHHGPQPGGTAAADAADLPAVHLAGASLTAEST